MVNNSYISAHAPYFGTEITLVEDHDVDDIIRGLIKKHSKEQAIYDGFSDQFWAGTARATAKNIFDWLKKNVQYKIEVPDLQTIKSPGAIINDRYGDCKHYASFANGVLASLQRKGYNVPGEVIYRYAGYAPGSNDVHHVFSVLKNGTKEIWIDPVLSSFDYHKPYAAHKDKIVSSMPLKEINGIDYPMYNANVGNVFDDIKKGWQNTKAAVTKGTQNTTKAVTKGAENTYNKVKHPVMAINFAAARNSFLLLVKMNAFNLAHRLYDFMHRNKAQEQELFTFWKEKLGGTPSALHNNIEEGMRGYLARHKISAAEYNKKNNFLNGMQMPLQSMPYYQYMCYCFPLHMPGMSDGKTLRNSVGVEPVSAAALMTAAATIIAALAPILKRAGWSESDKQNAANIDKMGQMALSAAAAAGGTNTAGNLLFPDGSTKNMLTTTVDTMADGTKVIRVDDTGTLSSQTGGGAISESIKQMWDSLKSTVLEYKYPIMIGTTAIILYKSGILNTTKKRARK